MAMPSPLPEPDWSRTPAPDPIGEAVRNAERVADIRRSAAARVTQEGVAVTDEALAWSSFPYFLTRLRDDRGRPLSLFWHIEEWALLMQHERLLCLMAARDHGKSWTVYAYIAWRIWCHNRRPDGQMDWTMPDGLLQVVYVTAAHPLAIQRMEQNIKPFLTQNLTLFHEVLPVREGGTPGPHGSKTTWNKTTFRLRNNVFLVVRSVGASMRGLHPQVLIGDDIVDNKNSATEEQRAKVWDYVSGTMMPMAGANREVQPGDDPRDFGTMFVIGTPQHQTDTLHRLKGAPNWRHVKYRAADFDNGFVLWPERYSLQSLRDIQATDTLVFSREYQMEPRDDASSLFPYAVTERVLLHGTGWIRPYHHTLRAAGEFIIMGGDLAVSESVGADYTVLVVVAYNRWTQRRRVLWACRERGLSWQEVVLLIRTVCREMGVDIGVVEQNGFQRWLHQELAKWPETNTRIFGHNTGLEKQDLEMGVPGLKLALQNLLWEVPSGLDPVTQRPDPALTREAEWCSAWRSELNSMGYVNGKLTSTAAHDDTVMGSWFVERGVRMVEAHLGPAETGDMVYAEDVLGVPRVRIGNV